VSKKPRSVGRPKLPKGHAKARIVPVRFKADDLRRITAAAKASNQTVSEFIRQGIRPMTMPTPEEFKERNPTATPPAITAYRRLYDTVGKSYNEMMESVQRFENDGGRGGYV
jgi:hypothetical protein